ncbi:MAG TPA: glycosyltransferase, partial [Saprospiraceae bacterium]|nr:glycosyltransferase [Saprospiraceae bacterium]
VGGVYDPLTLGQYLHASAIYVLAGMGGLSIYDAMCFAKPVVCSVADGTEKRLVREGYNGHYFSNGDADSLSERLAGLLANPARMQQFGQNSLHIIQHDINIHTVLEAYVRAFEYAIR